MTKEISHTNPMRQRVANRRGRPSLALRVDMRRRLGLTLLLSALLVAGCGRGPRLATVQGTVTLDGKPLSGAMVSFHPVGGGRQSYCRTDSDGHYELRYSAGLMGAQIGKHKVTVNTAGAEGAAAKLDKEKVPPKYNSKTTLEKEVTGGANMIDLELTSK